MIRRLSSKSLSFAALLALLSCARPSLAQLAVGQQAPGFTLQDLDGNQVSLESLKGKTVVLEWINPNCPVSRRHADIERMDDGSYEVRDAGSLNGTYVNGERVEKATLSNGDEVQIGKFRMVFLDALGGTA